MTNITPERPQTAHYEGGRVEKGGYSNAYCNKSGLKLVAYNVEWI